MQDQLLITFLTGYPSGCWKDCFLNVARDQVEELPSEEKKLGNLTKVTLKDVHNQVHNQDSAQVASRVHCRMETKPQTDLTLRLLEEMIFHVTS